MYATESSKQDIAEYSHFPVSAYGAEGDGSTDDTAAIQSAIDAAIDNGGGIVSVGAGEYRITSSLTLTDANSIVISGTGKGSILFMDSREGTLLSINSTRESSDQSESGSHPAKSAHNRIQDLTIDRSTEPAVDSTGIHVKDALNTTLSGLSVFNQGRGVAVGMSGSHKHVPENTQIENSNFENHTSEFGRFGYPDAAIKVYSSKNTEVQDTFVSGTNTGMDIVESSHHVSISQCIFLHGGVPPNSHGELDEKHNLRAIGDGRDRRVVSSVFEAPPEHNVKIGGTSTGFQFINSWIGVGGRKGIVIGKDVSHVTILNNRIGHQPEEGIYSRGDNVNVQGNIMVDNVFANRGRSIDSVYFKDSRHIQFVSNKVWSNWERDGIHIAGKSNDFLVSGNDFYEYWADFEGGIYVDVVETGDRYTVDHNLTLTLPGTRLSLANVSFKQNIVERGSTFDVDAEVANVSAHTWEDVSLELTGPAGWELTEMTATRFDETERDDSVSAEWAVVPSSDAETGDHTLTLTVTYTEDGSTNTVKGGSTTVSVPPSPPTGDTHLSDHDWISATTGWGEVGRDEAVNGSEISIGGQTYEKGLGTHARSEILYYLEGNMSRFVVDVGIDDAVGDNGNGEFVVVGDGEVLQETDALTGADDAVSLDVDISGVDYLELIVTDGADDNEDWTWGNWAIAEVQDSS